MLPVASLVAAALTIAGAVADPLDDGAAASTKPNVVLLMTDDQTLADMQAMPRTRRLIGGAGTTFAKSYVSYPLCCPSRATALTGQYAHNHGVLENALPFGGYDRLDGDHTIAVWLEEAGYRTTHIGKYLNGYGRNGRPDVPPGWGDWQGGVDPHTYSNWGYELYENGTLRTYGTPTVQAPALYQPDVYGDKAVDAIRERAGDDAPFFLSVAFLAPHAETVTGLRSRPPGQPSIRPAPRHRGAFAFQPLDPSPAFDERDVSDKPPFIRRQPALSARRKATILRNFRARRESLLAVDEAIERIVDALGQTGELDDTYILFTSDNGFFHGEHRVAQGKYLAYDAASHVPLLVRGPGIAAGGVSDELVSNVDLAPTIADLAGARPTKPMDGRSLLPYARLPALRSARPLLHEGLRAGDIERDFVFPVRRRRWRPMPHYAAVRTQRWLYIKAGRHRELYDLRNDPHELSSLHADPRHAPIRARLAHRLRQLRRCSSASCR